MTHTRRWLWAGGFAAGLVIVAFFSRSYWLTGLASYLVQTDTPARADAVVVLAGDGQGNRILTAADLVRRGYAPKVLLSSGEPVFGFHEGELAMRFAVKQGYPPEYFEPLLIRANSTEEEAARVLPELRRRGIRAFLLVTSDFHTRRAGTVFRRAAGNDLRVLVIGAPSPPFAPASWWHSRPGRKVFAQEWMKTVAYAIGL